VYNLEGSDGRGMKHAWKSELYTKFLSADLKEREDLEDLGIDRRIILNWILKKCESVDWIHLAQNRDQWRVLENPIMNLPVL
jgi:hypothetical protein